MGSSSKNYRYQLIIIDDTTNDNNNDNNKEQEDTVVFYIPQGRESEYIFSTYNGLLNILHSANTKRLISVSFHRDEIYYDDSSSSSSLQSCQDELEYIVQVLSYNSDSDNRNNNKKIPFMALDNNI